MESLAGSFAINTGDRLTNQPGGPQAGASDLADNPRIIDSLIDIGAYERQMKQQEITFGSLENDTITTTYGDADFSPAFVTAADGSLTDADITYSVPADNHVATVVDGKIHIIGAGEVNVTASAAGNSEYDAAPGITKVLHVSRKLLTITASNCTKTYGDELTFDGTEFGSSGLLDNDTVTSVTLSSTGASATAGVSGSPYDILVSDATGTGLDNYVITYMKGKLTVNKKSLTVTADDKSKTYGDANPALTVSYDGLVNDETALSPAPTLSTSATAASGAGVYDIEVSGSSANYDITFIRGKLTVRKKSLTVTADDKSKTYGEANPVLTVSYDGLVNDETALSPAPTLSTSATAASGAGVYDIEVSGSSVNYDITFIKGKLTVRKKSLTITAKDQNKIYGEIITFTGTGFTTSGLINNDVVNRVTLSSRGASATASASTTPYDIEVSGAVGTGLDNYIISYATGKLTINKKALTIKAENKTRFAGTTNPELTVSYEGFVNGEDASVLRVKPVVSTVAVTDSPIGDYPITVSAAAADNYTINYVSGTLKVVPGAPISIDLESERLFENQPSGTLAGILTSTSDDPDATFSYSLMSGEGDTDNELFTISGEQLKTAVSLNYEQKSSYTVRVRSTTQYGFSLEKSFTIDIGDVNEAPTLNEIDDRAICYTADKQSIPLSGISAGEDAGQTTSLLISSSLDVFSELEISGNEIQYRLKKGFSGTAEITITVKDNGDTANGGTDSFSGSFKLVVNPLPAVHIVSDLGADIPKGAEVHLRATGGVSYQWANAAGIMSEQNQGTLTVRPAQTTTYRVVATNATGCSSIQEITLNVKDDHSILEANNIMSPDGDGVNDKLVIKNLDMYSNNTIKIFDRAGRILYSRKHYDNEWDGTINGVPLAEGTYFYIVDFGSKAGKVKGFVTIVRNR